MKSKRDALRALALVTFCMVLNNCHSGQRDLPPSIEFTKIPPAARGGRERTDTISGRVTGARPGQMIVIYARSGPWWVQPWPDRPLIPIRADSTWSTETHLGYEYAALLVDSSYHPLPTMDLPPAQGGSVALVRIVKGVGTLPPLPTKAIQFSGYNWKVRIGDANRGGVNNQYDADNVWTDETGALHLKIARKSGIWTCAQVFLTRSLGYGTYMFVVRDTTHLEPAAVLSVHTFDEWAGDQNYREMDIEIGRWGDAGSKTNAQFGVQPFYVPGNVARFTEPPGTLTQVMVWEPGRATFATFSGSAAPSNARPIYKHTFISGAPSAGKELVELMFYVVPSETAPLQGDNEIVIDKFQYLP